MNDCSCGIGKLAPCGRTRIRLLDDSIMELLVFKCLHCKEVKFQTPTLSCKSNGSAGFVEILASPSG